MKTLLSLFILILFAGVSGGCKKDKPAKEIQERKVFYAASLTPVKLNIDKDLRGTVYFKAQDVPYYIMLDHLKANSTVGLITNAIKEETLLKLYMYSGSLEIARIEQ